jgi:hypothetical protein
LASRRWRAIHTDLVASVRCCDALATLGRCLATWRSGYAAACKAVYTGSIPVVALSAPRARRDGS